MAVSPLSSPVCFTLQSALLKQDAHPIPDSPYRPPEENHTRHKVAVVAFPSLGSPARLPLTSTSSQALNGQRKRKQSPSGIDAASPAKRRLSTSTLVSPCVKLGEWKVRRSLGGRIHSSPPPSQKKLMRRITNAIYVIKRQSPGGSVSSTYAGSVARSHPEVKQPNNVVRRFGTYNRELRKLKKNRPIIREMRQNPEHCTVTVYRQVQGGVAELHEAEAETIEHVRKKYPNAKNLNVTDPRKEPDLTGPRLHLRGPRSVATSKPQQ